VLVRDDDVAERLPRPLERRGGLVDAREERVDVEVAAWPQLAGQEEPVVGAAHDVRVRRPTEQAVVDRGLDGDGLCPAREVVGHEPIHRREQ
jgi:hypothetical protein